MPTIAKAELLERDKELDALAVAVAEAVAGDGRLVVVEGPAGIGKTRLADAARALATEAGMRILAGRGSEMERAFPFGLVRQLFEPALARVMPAERAELFAGPARLVERLLAGDGAGADPFALYHGLYWLTANLSAAAPLALIVDDFHWCDPPSQAALEYVARRLEGLPVLAVVAARSQEPGFDRTILDTLAREPAAVVVAPSALSAQASAELVRSRLGADAADDFCRACHAATGGNPLLVSALVSALIDEGITGRADEVDRVAVVGPEAVSRAVRLRLAGLDERARALVHAASVLGDGALLADAAALAGLAPDETASAAGLLAAAGLLGEQETVAFVHPVIGAAVYASLGRLEQRDAHARAARLLVALDRPPEAVAAHILHGPASGDPEAVEVLRAAAARSLTDGAAGLAVAYLRRALEEPPEHDRRADVLFELGRAEQLVAGPDAAGHLREALDSAREPARRAEITLGLGQALYFGGATLDAKAVFERALAEPSLDPKATRSIETGLVVLGLFEPDLIALARVRLHGFDPDGSLDDESSRILLAYGTYDEARAGVPLEKTVERVQRVLATGGLAEESQGASWAASIGVLWAADRLDDAKRLAEEVTRAGEEHGSAFLASSGLAIQAGTLRRRGALAEAQAYYASSVEMAEAHGFATVTNWVGGQYAATLCDRGDPGAALELLVRLGMSGPLPDTVHLYEMQLARGRALVGMGRAPEGLDDLQEVGRRWDAIGARNPEIAPWRAFLAEALLPLGRTDEALRLAEEHLFLARAWGAARPLAQALRVHGLALGADEDLLRQSVDVARTSPGRLELALSLVELGAAERRSNRRRSARALLEEGLSLAHACGAHGLQDRALRELLAAGARPRRAPASGRDALTPSELRVAELAATGQTNREIAQRLFVTQKTVEAHLARTFRKLQIESRAQLAGALQGR